MKKYDIITAFDICVDMILDLGNAEPEFGQKEKLINGYNLEMGGSACIFASQCAKLGLKTTGIGAIGDDSFGEFMKMSLQNNGVCVSNLKLAENKTAVTICLNKSNGDRGMLTYMGNINAVKKEWLLELLPQTRHLHICSFFLFENLIDFYPEICKKAKELGVTISLDTNWDPNETWDSGLKDVLPYIDIFLPNENELMLITGKSNIKEALESVKIPIIVVKCGDKGAYVYNRGEIYKQPALEVDFIDAVGAGDSFNGGFVYGFLSGLSMQECLKLGTICGSLNVTKSGGTAGQPNINDIRRYI